jgi:hypothetical protein
MLKIFYEASDTVHSGHCCIYSHNGGYSYLALPTHCFPYNSKKQYKIWATDYEGRTIDLELVEICNSTIHDAEVLVTKKIFGLPSLCEMAILTGYRASGDSAFIFSPFNSRGIEKKWGTFTNRTTLTMDTMICERGDSGSLVISREGVTGITVAVTNNGLIMEYVPILVFEKLYGDLIFNK